MTQDSSIGTLLTQWLATVSPTFFTHGDARKGIEVLRGSVPLSQAERAVLSVELETRIAGGWLTREEDGKKRKNYYNLEKRPEVAKVLPIADRPVQQQVAERPPRHVSKEMFERFLTAFLAVIASNNYESRKNGVRVVRIKAVLDRTVTLVHREPVRLADIHYELLDAVAFGLFWYNDRHDADCFLWRESTDWILMEYGRQGMDKLVNVVLSGTRASRQRAANDR